MKIKLNKIDKKTTNIDDISRVCNLSNHIINREPLPKWNLLDFSDYIKLGPLC